MDYNKQNRGQQGQQPDWNQQNQWRDGNDTNPDYNRQNAGQQRTYGEQYHGNLKQREEETNRARGHNYGHEEGNRRYSQDYDQGGYGKVGNTGGGNSDWNSYGSSGNDMGGNYERRSQDYDNRFNAGNYGQRQGGYNRQNSGYGQGGNQYGQNRYQGNDNDNDWWDRAKNKVSSWFSDDDDRNEGNRRNYNMHEGNRHNVDNSSEQQGRGQHWGKGPRGYQRSEDRIREDVCERLAYDGHVDASDIDVKVEGTEVILTGTVRSRAEKRRAEDLVDSIMGVHNVENRIRVNNEQSGGWQQAGNHRTDDSSRNDNDTNRTAAARTGNSSLESRSYTGNSGDGTGIGTESGTTNEIIRNSGTADTNL
jgi:osmotically-inducible protein OsmY